MVSKLLLPRFASYVLLQCSLVVCTSCPDSFRQYDEECYFFSAELHNFTECQQRICASANGTLAVVSNAGLNDFLTSWYLNMSLQRLSMAAPAFIGLYERGADESGDWAWVNGSNLTFSAWSIGEPNNWCLDEDCVVLDVMSSPGWRDVSCAVDGFCLCQHTGVGTHDLQVKIDEMRNTTVESNYERCFSDRTHCWWWGNASSQAAFVCMGVPCVLLMLFALGGTCEFRYSSAKLSTPDELDTSAYGELIDSSDASAEDDVDRWIVRGAWSAISYAGALMALAVGTLLHVIYGLHPGFYMDILASAGMGACKLLVGVCALKVNQRLSLASRAVAAFWVLILAVSELLLAVSMLALSLSYIAITLLGRSSGTFCSMTYMLCQLFLLSMVFQTGAGYALFRIHERAIAHAGDASVFTNIIGGSWILLVASVFGSGFCLGVCGGLLVFDDPDDNLDPLELIGFFYVVSACCEFFAGAAMLRANLQLRAYFGARSSAGQSSRSARVVELAAGSFQGSRSGMPQF
eukprot:TRINITY_DN28991_c0_g1_i1.p1 TRINITY_DN28991_c0_g1~~TRINITY_DN28991_c0_g1_i1.p1  ORF type:complete len:520 (-),score=43.29 TRINITY_DN28991_c0_g1_i1:118-1677(-)